MDILEKCNVTLSHNPISNMKLAVGNAFNYPELKKRNINLTLGTDGCSSNNNQDMFEEMKIAALLQKHHHNNPTELTADEIYKMATLNGHKAFNIDAGEIKEGKLADLILVNLNTPSMIPNHNLISNLVYSGDKSIVNTTICNGKILMKNGIIENEQEILDQAIECVNNLMKK